MIIPALLTLHSGMIICILLLFSCFSPVSGYVILDWHLGWIDPEYYLSFGQKRLFLSMSHLFMLVPSAFSHKGIYIIPTSQPCPLFLSLLVARTWCLQQSSALETSYWPRFAKIRDMSSSEKAKANIGVASIHVTAWPDTTHGWHRCIHFNIYSYKTGVVQYISVLWTFMRIFTAIHCEQ